MEDSIVEHLARIFFTRHKKPDLVIAKGTRFRSVFGVLFDSFSDKIIESSDQEPSLINRRQVTPQVRKTLNNRLREHAFPVFRDL